MSEFGFVYDSSIIAPFSDPPLWPYTLDHGLPHSCIRAEQLCPTRSYPNIWELPLNQLSADVSGQSSRAEMLVCFVFFWFFFFTQPCSEARVLAYTATLQRARVATNIVGTRHERSREIAMTNLSNIFSGIYQHHLHHRRLVSFRFIRRGDIQDAHAKLQKALSRQSRAFQFALSRIVVSRSNASLCI